MANERRLIDANAYAYPGDLVNEPTVDAVEVVRCEYCEHRKEAIDHNGNGLFCSIWGREWQRVQPNDFCSYGERRCE